MLNAKLDANAKLGANACGGDISVFECDNIEFSIRSGTYHILIDIINLRIWPE